MTGYGLCELLGEVNPAYVQEARRQPAPAPSRGKWGLRVACFAAGFLLLTASLTGNPKSSQEPMTDAASPLAPAFVSMGDIRVNEIAGDTVGIDMVKRWYDPEQYRYEDWDWEQVTAYYGRELTPAYLPAGLTGAPSNGTVQAVRKPDGTVVEDTVRLAFYHDYYEDGSPMLTRDVAAPLGFSLTASRLGLDQGCFYLDPQGTERSVSTVLGTEVTFGHCNASYGPYDPQTHAPAGFYDIYVAEFEQDGILFCLIAEQLDLEEVVRVAASLISGQAVVDVIH